MELGQPEAERERRDEDDPAADAEEPGEDAADEADQRDDDVPHTRSRNPTTASRSEKPYESWRTGTRCCIAVPARTPTTAGMPTSAAAPGLISPCSA